MTEIERFWRALRLVAARNASEETPERVVAEIQQLIAPKALKITFKKKK